MKLPAYPRYKASGVEWLGEVPEYWERIRLGYEADLLVPMRDKPEDLTGPIPWVRIEDFTGRYLEGSKSGQGVSQETARAMHLKVFPVGTVLCSCSCSMGATAIARTALVSNQTFIGIVPSRRLLAEFLFYALGVAKGHLDSVATGAIQQYLSRSDFSQLRLVIPCAAEQHAITAYLDRATALIDGLVAKKRELIERLKEKRSALISRTVTRGLPPAAALAAGMPVNPPMKDSGIEWLGEIPGHWGAKKLGYGAALQGGYAFASEKFDSEGVPVVRMNNLKRGIVDTTQASCIAPENCVDAFALAEGDLLWGMSGSVGETGSLGNFARVRDSDLPAQLNQRVGRFRVLGDQMSLNFLTFVIQTKFFYDQILLFVTGTAQFNVSSAQVQSVFIPFPPLAEQHAIAAYLDAETAKLDALVAKVEEAVERLQEYRSALITAAVTGKIDVRNCQPRIQP